MTTYSSVLLSESTDGRPIQLGATAVALHTAGTASGTHDEIHLFAANGATHDSVLFVNIGATTVGRQVVFTVPTKDGAYTILPGVRVTSSLALTAHLGTTSSSTGVVVAFGHVNRIST